MERMGVGYEGWGIGNGADLMGGGSATFLRIPFGIDLTFEPC